MTKLLSAKELLEVVRTAQADVQAAGGGAKWPPRMALGGRSGPRKRAVEQARERDAKALAPPPRRPRGGTIPVMQAVTAPIPARPLPAPPPPAPPPPAPPPPAMAFPLPTGGGDELPPASALLAAMRAKSNPLPVPREPEPLEIKRQLLESPPAPPSTAPPADPAFPSTPEMESRRRARTQPMPSQPPQGPSPGSPAASLAALFGGPPPRLPDPPPPSPRTAPSQPDLALPPSRPPAPTSPDPSVLRRSPEGRSPEGRSPEGRSPEGRWPSTPPLRREEDEEPAPAIARAPLALELPDLEIEVKQAPRLSPQSTAPPNTDRQVIRRDARTEDVRLRPPTGGAAARREKASSASAFSALAKLAAPPKPQEAISSPASPPAAGQAEAPPSDRAVARPPGPAAAPPKAPSMDLSWVTSKPSWAPTSAALDEAEPEDEGEAPVALSKDETIVLLNYDATDSLEAISQRTGFSVFKVERIVDRLMSQGVFDDLPTAATAPDSKPRPQAGKDHAPSSGSILAAAQAEPPPESLEGPPTVAEPEGPEIETKEDDDDVDEDDADEEDSPDSAAETRRGEETEDAATEAELEANYRKLYETKLARLGADQRIAIATTGSGADLFALCFDKDPSVFRPLFENEHFFVDQARFAAFHHPTSAGIDRLAQRNELLKDPLVQRRLLRNGHTPELVVRRILASRRLLDVFKVTNDRDVPDRQRMVARGTLRQKFTTADPEERLQLLWNTEGRALTLLSGCAIDSKTTALFCARPVVSLLMVQNFAKFGATPPGMLNHFLKQNLVRRQIPLRNMLLKHPNCPSEAKRGF